MSTKPILTEVYSSFQIEGIHRWENCPIEEVKYLGDDHRHMFHFKVVAEVNHDDRDIEFIQFMHEVRDFILDTYYDHCWRCCYFGGKSCEMLAREIIDNFSHVEITRVEVSEDGENGAILTVGV